MISIEMGIEEPVIRTMVCIGHVSI